MLIIAYVKFGVLRLASLSLWLAVAKADAAYIAVAVMILNLA